MVPQIAVGGIGTSRGYSPMRYAADVAVLAYKRWPDAFSMSHCINEPELYGVEGVRLPAARSGMRVRAAASRWGRVCCWANWDQTIRPGGCARWLALRPRDG
jgi:hypothetical protein